MTHHQFNLHLGDNAEVGFGDFKDATFVGLEVVIPVILRDIVENEIPKIIINTSNIETLADWQAHTVHLDQFFLGYICDKSGNRKEQFEFIIPPEMIDGSPRKLSIRIVGKGPGLEDDFILKKIESIGFDLYFGWV